MSYSNRAVEKTLRYQVSFKLDNILLYALLAQKVEFFLSIQGLKAEVIKHYTVYFMYII